MMLTLKEKMQHYTLPQQLKSKGLYPFFRVIESDQDTEVRMNGQKVLMFGSNSYLGLTNHPSIKKAAQEGVAQYGTGCAGSRFLNGTLDIHLELERRLAEYVGKEDAMVFSTGYQANLGTIAALCGRNDCLILDELDHASIIDGSRLSFADVLKFRHNDMHSLEEKLKSVKKPGLKLIAVDGVFSMEGDLARLNEIIYLAEKYNASVMVDEAHSLGVFGRNGSGIVSHMGLTQKVEVIMGTFSKSLASIGGFIAGDSATINFLRHNARSFMFSASITPSAAASVLAALDIINQEPERIQLLWRNTHFAINTMKGLGMEIGATQSPIIPVYIRDDAKTFILTHRLQQEGIFVNPVVPPSVAPDSSLIRFSLMATHTIQQIDTAIHKMYDIMKQLNLFTIEDNCYDTNKKSSKF